MAAYSLTIETSKHQLEISEEPYMDSLILTARLDPPATLPVFLSLFHEGGGGVDVLRLDLEHGLCMERYGYSEDMPAGRWTCTRVECDGGIVDLVQPFSVEVIARAC